MIPLWLGIGVVLGIVISMPGLIVLLRRATHRAREAEREARHAQRLAELGSMTSGLAHEIKNPLSTVGLNAQLLREDLVDLEVSSSDRSRLTDRVDALAREVDRLGSILSDFLDFAGRIRLDPQEHDLSAIVEELSDFYHPQCEKAGVILRVQLPPEPVSVRVDESLLKQSLLNLMINATQVLEAQRVGATSERLDDELILKVEQDETTARIHVIDTGPGVPEADRESIFHPYVSGRKGGTGLGLPTARRIIEEHGGRLEVDSMAGRGSDFMISLPRA
ncbi:MAG: HAMP domain-containing sensor histidine kinase [Planctomycetota bacterium]|nr:HAMP domain-containing sensor histidine kinase [Planctomycetota bacterium]